MKPDKEAANFTNKDTNIASIQVQDFNSTEINLMEEYKGKPLLIIIYNNQCLGCTGRAIPFAYQCQQKFETLQVIGIHSNFGKNRTTEEDVKSIFTINELPFPIYLDQEHKVYDLFQSEGTPQWLLITADGQLSRSIFGSQEGAQNRLMYALEELLA
ncbi:redoxin domain-containing protein [Ancylomarina sp. 16SWW S1-10-2]|uniref:TlpA family protein disulfide reductase n=1 Tax=Ancylomarina sp. 16SWW S1-10-2 TaxID=2499681 RepID=UPI0012AD58CC|nr:redoxin domain-containing protein [Ancylomarina sp. 16SWW S1-10-2]MRT92906.1 redoxin domain-containing protein [Ancylomarina sp. 16SWW S1-10-2]